MTIQLTVDRQAVETKADELLIDLLLRREAKMPCVSRTSSIGWKMR